VQNSKKHPLWEKNKADTLHKHSLWYVEHVEKIPHVFHMGKLVPKPFSIMAHEQYKNEK